MGPFPSSMGNQFILIAVDYISKWIKSIYSPTNDARVVIKMFKKFIFPRFRVPRLVISDYGSHFISRQFENLLKNMELGTELQPFIICKQVAKWKSLTEKSRHS